jgi:hypothetical protein
MNFNQREGAPVGNRINMLLSERLNLDGLVFVTIAIMENTYETFDSILDPLKTPNQEGSFYTASGPIISNQPRMLLNPTVKDILFKVNIQALNKKVEHSREVYNLLDLIGDIGGVLDVLLLLFGLLIYPISEHSFVLKAIEKLFLAHSVQENVFVKQTKNKNKKFRSLKVKIPEVFKNTEVENHVQKDFPIRLTL